MPSEAGIDVDLAWAWPAIHLASQSPRRRELLAQLGVSFTVLDVAIDESRQATEAPQAYVQRMAYEKALAGLAVDDSLPVLGSDTTVVLPEQDRVLGKPVDKDDALSMLSALSGRTHTVMTAVAVLVGRADGQMESQFKISSSEVTFRQLSADEMTQYWHTGEPIGKAGAYAVQGLGAMFIEHVAGSYSGIMGLPLYETAACLRAIGEHLTSIQPTTIQRP